MFAVLIVAVSALCSTQATGPIEKTPYRKMDDIYQWYAAIEAFQDMSQLILSQKINDLHLHAKLGADLRESVPLTDSLDVVDQHVSLVAQKLVKKQMPKRSFLFKTMYGPIENVVLPGVKLPRPINLTKISMTGLNGLQLNGLQWRMASNRVMCNATIPFLLVDVTFNNIQIELDENFGDEEFFTNIRLSVRLLDLEILASARYNIKGMPTGPDLLIDKAEVDINAREAVVELKVVQGLEEVRYVLSELLNNPLDDIMDAVLKVVVEEINKELLKVDPKKVTNYLISQVPQNSKVPKELIVINRV